MSYTTITIATNDEALQDRVTAAAMKEAIAGAPEFAETQFGEQLRRNPFLALNQFMWPVCIDYEAEYAYALGTENPDPGGDEGVITDANIQAAVQAHWPDEPAQLPQEPFFEP